ncbi:hypothetical protein LXA43DRAFT_991102 [Ganoderma leucocontextum]|nr:hypothetical protein LXA43DRAFT_991102 [Ganoderma leucocontextum]
MIFITIYSSETAVGHHTTSWPQPSLSVLLRLSSYLALLSHSISLSSTMTEIVSVAKVGVEVCVKYLAPTNNLHKGIERQANILDLVLENAKYFDQETREQLDQMQERLEKKRAKVAGGQATVSWKYFFHNISCIKRARVFASLASDTLAETRLLSTSAKRDYEARQKTIVASESLSITLDNVELSKGTKSLELPFPLNKDYIASATFHLRPAEGTTETSIAIPEGAQSVTLNGVMDLIEHALSEHSDGEMHGDVEVAFREMTCTVVP